MFKIGQKVRVVGWIDMPKHIQYGWGILTRCIGEVLTIKTIGESYEGFSVYELEGSSAGEWGLMALEPELEPFVRVGEQLLFDFIKE